MRVSTDLRSSARPAVALFARWRPSKAKGRVTTPTVRAPILRAISATTGAAPVPVPPPSPAVTKTMSASSRAERIISEFSSAARRPTAGSAPAPRPRETSLPMSSFVSASDLTRDCPSVLMAMNSTPASPSWIMRSTALTPPPPTPMTLMFAPLLRAGIVPSFLSNLKRYLRVFASGFADKVKVMLTRFNDPAGRVANSDRPGPGAADRRGLRPGGPPPRRPEAPDGRRAAWIPPQ